MPNGNSMSMFRNKDDFRIDQLRYALCEVIAKTFDESMSVEGRFNDIRDIVNESLTRDNAIAGS